MDDEKGGTTAALVEAKSSVKEDSEVEITAVDIENSINCENGTVSDWTSIVCEVSTEEV